MLLFVYGEDGYRVREKVREFRDAFKAKHDPAGMNLATFDANAKVPIGEVFQAIRSAPFMGAKRMVLLRGLLSLNAKEAAPWIDGLSTVPESTIVVVWEITDGAVEKKAVLKELGGGAATHTYPFPALTGVALEKWVGDRFKALGTTTSSDVVRELVSRVGADLWQLSLEMQKLIAYASPNAVTRADVEQLTRASFEGEIFALIDAVSRRDAKLATQLLMKERAAGTSDYQTLSMFARQIRILLAARALLDENPRASSGDFADAMSLHPFVAGKSLTQARSFTREQLLAAHDAIFMRERESKRGGIDAELAVDLTLTDLVQK